MKTGLTLLNPSSSPTLRKSVAGGTRPALQRLLGIAAGVLLAAALHACGGGTTSDVSPPRQTSMPTLSGQVTTGDSTTDLTTREVTVKGTTGTARTTNGVPIDGQGYLASLDKLTGPYWLGTFYSTSGFGPVSVATQPGTANVTPLTTLLVAQLLGTDPNVYFGLLSAQQSVGIAVDAAALQTADRRVRRYLQRELDFTVPATLGDFVTTPYQKVPGDLMHDTITALVARAGDYLQLANALALETARCKLEKVVVVSGGVSDEFCPFSKSNEFEDADITVQAIGFVNRHGDTLTVRVRGSDVLTAQLRTAESASFQCSGAGCAGIALGTPAGDLTRPVNFSAVTLTGAQGTARLDGTLRTSVPGIALPGLPCNANRYDLIAPDRTVTGYCAGPDDAGIGQGGPGFKTGPNRVAYLFNPVTDQAAYQFLRVVVDGDRVIGAAVVSSDGSVPNYACAGSVCAGLTLGTARIDTSQGFASQLRTLVFDDVVMGAVQSDGSLSTTDTLKLRAEVVGAFTPPAPFTTVACADPAQSLAVQTSDGAPPVTICVPADTQGFTLSGTFPDGSGGAGLFLGSLLDDGNGGFGVGDGVTINIAADDSVVSMSFGDRLGTSYECLGSACIGVTVSAPNGAGERTVSFAGTPLREANQIAVLGDRTATVTGSFVAPPP